MINSYKGLSSHYDLIMTSGYYDYNDYSQTILELIGGRRQVLELGVGTGLVCEKLLGSAMDDLRITGIDHTEAMLVQARKRLGGRVRLIRQDVLQMTMPPSFEAAFSVGGIWYNINDNGNVTLCSHLLDEGENIRALGNLHKAMKPDGMLLLATQGPHLDYARELPDGLTYVQKVHAVSDGQFIKDYYVKQQDNVVTHQRSRYRLFPRNEADLLLSACGFRFECVSQNGLFHQYVRTPRGSLR